MARRIQVYHPYILRETESCTPYGVRIELRAPEHRIMSRRYDEPDSPADQMIRG